MENSRLLNDEQIKGIMGGEAMELKAVIDTAVTYKVEASQEDKAMSDNVMSQDHLYQRASEHDIYEALFRLGLNMDTTQVLAGLLHCTGYTNQQTEFLKIVIDFHNKIKARNKKEQSNVLNRLDPKELVGEVKKEIEAWGNLINAVCSGEMNAYNDSSPNTENTLSEDNDK